MRREQKTPDGCFFVFAVFIDSSDPARSPSSPAILFWFIKETHT